MAQPLWYLRHAGTVLGPYPTPQVRELLRSGAISPDWDVSLDEKDWLPLTHAAQLLPDDEPGMGAEPADEKTAWEVERQRAQERWQGQEPPVEHDARLDEARRQALERDEVRTGQLVAAERRRRPPLLIAALALLALAVVGVVVKWGESEQPIQASLNQAVNCAAAVDEGVNWSGCDKRGAALAGAHLRNARLVKTRLDDAQMPGASLEYAQAGGASLRNVDLSGARLTAADLTGADLSAADLNAANLHYAVLEGALLNGTRMDGATWTDGRICAPGSIGECR
jgi:hypothetical protein